MDCRLRGSVESSENHGTTFQCSNVPHYDNLKENQEDKKTQQPQSIITYITSLFENCCPTERTHSSSSTTLNELDTNLPPISDWSATQSPWLPRTNLTLDKCREKMLKNTKKAIEEHFRKNVNEMFTLNAYFFSGSSNPYPNQEQTVEVFKEIEQQNITNVNSLQTSCHISREQGPREKMEDADFFTETENYILAGVFDGHCGQYTAKHAMSWFPKKFAEYISPDLDNVHSAFELTVHAIHKEIEIQAKDWEMNYEGIRLQSGSTMVCCCIDKRNGFIYTATIGDSEANIYRDIQGAFKSIPLSCVRDWSCKKEALRAAIALDNPTIAYEWPRAKESKYLRFPDRHGINLSRAIGDIRFQGTEEKPGVIHKPKITLNKIKAGDRIVLCCDGLKDFLMEKKILEVIKNSKNENPAEELVQEALANMIEVVDGKGNAKVIGDNVTVLYITIDQKNPSSS